MRGDFLQYRKRDVSLDEEQRRRRGNIGSPPESDEGAEFVSDARLLFNGKVPVHQTCDKCHTRLAAFARILDGWFSGIVEIKSDREEGVIVIDRTEVTAKSLREETARRLTGLQKSCNHEGSRWMHPEWAPGALSRRVLVYNKCEKILENDPDRRLVSRWPYAEFTGQ